MTNPTDPQSIIQKTRDLCKAATPGPWNVMAVVDEDQIAVISVHVIDLRQCTSADEELLDDARTLLPELADALEEALRAVVDDEGGREMHRQMRAFSDTAVDLENELADQKAKMVGLLADAYDKGRRFSEDEDDRTSEDD